MVVQTARPEGRERARSGDGVPPDQPPARLSDLRRSGGVQASGLCLQVQRRREPVRRGQGPQAETGGAGSARPAGHRTVHHVLALRPVLRRDRGEAPADIHPAGRPCRADDIPGRTAGQSVRHEYDRHLPGGALTSRDFRFKARVWEMSSTETRLSGLLTRLQHVLAGSGTTRSSGRPRAQSGRERLLDVRRTDGSTPSGRSMPSSASRPR